MNLIDKNIIFINSSVYYFINDMWFIVEEKIEKWNTGTTEIIEIVPNILYEVGDMVWMIKQQLRIKKIDRLSSF